jgi:hypothetical protein
VAVGDLKVNGKKELGSVIDPTSPEKHTWAAATLTSDEEPNVLPRKAKGRPWLSNPETCEEEKKETEDVRVKCCKGDEEDVMEWRCQEN